jgi:predicted phage baseplate assembly protein
LAYQYKRDTIKIYANVVKATHGETRKQVLGSGDGSQARQTFALRGSPLTYLPAATPAGAESTLEVRVNDVRWHEENNLFELEPKQRAYITRMDDDNQTTIAFGDGSRGARLPSGVENVAAVYRAGIGKGGNVKAEQISTLATQPLGVEGVINPLPASGGTDRESRDQARRNAPLAVMALDRLVSVQDYADFCLAYAGIGKASAVELSNGRRQVVYVTIAGADDIPIDKHSDLYRNLCQPSPAHPGGRTRANAASGQRQGASPGRLSMGVGRTQDPGGPAEDLGF